MSRPKYKETNIPKGIRLQVRYHRGPLWFTFCRLYDEGSGALLSHGQARCSKQDNPNKKIGRAIAVGRALKRYKEGLGSD